MRQNKIKVLILEHDIQRLQTTVEFVKKTANLQLTAGLQSSLKGLHKVFNSHIDLLLIGSDMPDMHLHEFLLQIKHLTRPQPNRRSLRVLVTSTQPLEKSMLAELGIFGLLSPPFDYETFVQKIHTVFESWNYKLLNPLPFSDLFLVRQSNGLQRTRINFNAIAYLQADSMDCKIWLSDSVHYTVNKPMAYVLSRLPDQDFKQCHRSFAININYVSHVEHSNVYLIGIQQVIPVGSRKVHVEFDLWDKTNSL